MGASIFAPVSATATVTGEPGMTRNQNAVLLAVVLATAFASPVAADDYVWGGKEGLASLNSLSSAEGEVVEKCQAKFGYRTNITGALFTKIHDTLEDIKDRMKKFIVTLPDYKNAKDKQQQLDLKMKYFNWRIGCGSSGNGKDSIATLWLEGTNNGGTNWYVYARITSKAYD
jgi:hypothetical protein